MSWPGERLRSVIFGLGGGGGIGHWDALYCPRTRGTICFSYLHVPIGHLAAFQMVTNRGVTVDNGPR